MLQHFLLGRLAFPHDLAGAHLTSIRSVWSCLSVATRADYCLIIDHLGVSNP